MSGYTRKGQNRKTFQLAGNLSARQTAINRAAASGKELTGR